MRLVPFTLVWDTSKEMNLRKYTFHHRRYILRARYNPLCSLRARVWQWYGFTWVADKKTVQLLRERLSRLPRSSAPLRMHLFDITVLFLSVFFSLSLLSLFDVEHWSGNIANNPAYFASQVRASKSDRLNPRASYLEPGGIIERFHA